MSESRSTEIEVLLGALGDHLGGIGSSATFLVVGGAALALRGVVSRTTQDVDVLGMQVEGRWLDADLSEDLKALVRRVARDFRVGEDWLDTKVASQWGMGLPPGFDEDLEWRTYGSLRVALAGRRLLVALKLFAAVDDGPDGVHLQDLRALEPDSGELERAREWVQTQDQSPQFSSFLDDVIGHVRHRE